jgi:hypothetical protein
MLNQLGFRRATYERERMKDCIFCRTPLLSVEAPGGHLDISCLRCGSYRISTEAVAFTDPDGFSEEQSANISGYIRENAGLMILTADISSLKALRTPPVAEKAMKGLVALTKRYPTAGAAISFSFEFAEQRRLLLGAASMDGKDINEACDDDLRVILELQSRCWARSFHELEYLIHYFLQAEGLAADSGNGYFVLTPRGWDRADQIRRGSIESDKAFVAMSFLPEYTNLFTNGLAPGIRAAGYDPVRIDRVEHNNRIDDEIIASIRRCKFLVADFSVNRGGIYFEAGFALGLGRPVIWTVRSEDLGDVHFDTRQYNFLRWTNDALPALTEALQNRIEASIGRGRL